MKKHLGKWIVPLALGLAALSFAACQGPVAALKSEASAPRKDAGDWIELEQGVWIPVRDPIGRNLKAAREAFQEAAFKESARELREAASGLLVEVPGLSDHGRDRLQVAARGLLDLAGRVERGHESLATLDQGLDQAYQAELENLWPLVETTVWVSMEGKAEEHFVAAQEALGRQDLKGASLEVGKAIALVRMQLGRAPLAARTALEGAIDELRLLGRDLEAGAVGDARGLDHAFSRAHRAMAASHQLAAKESLGAESNFQIGNELKASSDHLEKALRWSSETPEPAVASVLRETRSFAERLVADGAPRRRAEEETQSIAREIERLGKTVGVESQKPAVH